MGAPTVEFNSVLDLAALSGNTEYLYEPGARTRAQTTTDIVNTLVGGGWTVDTGPISQAHGDGYTLYGQQAPWYDEDNIPLWYVGNIPAIEIDNDLDAANLVLRAGVRRGGVITDLGGQFGGLGGKYNIAATGMVKMNFHACPFQFAMWSEFELPGSAHSFFISVLHQPKFVQEREKTIDLMVSSGKWQNDSQNVQAGDGYNIFRSQFDDSVLNVYQGVSQFVMLSGGIAKRTATGATFIWDPDGDLPPFVFSGNTATGEGATPNKTNHFTLPPMFVSKILPADTNFQIMGFPWDMLLIQDAFGAGSSEADFTANFRSTMAIAERQWVTFATSAKEFTPLTADPLNVTSTSHFAALLKTGDV